MLKPSVPPAKAVTPSATDVLAQAQAQWNAADQTGALALVQEAIARLEQSPVTDNAALAALAREHTRMSLAMGYPQAALATLVRLEPQLSSVPDIWALRGNINQRLGQHPRAVQAYLTGLSQRPNEPRWMLGAAVSLAIQGQTGPAAEWTEKARLAGGLRPDVANYLRQLGVDIRAD
jgi:tetratricopeptide (TPR) repeat protein